MDNENIFNWIVRDEISQNPDSNISKLIEKLRLNPRFTYRGSWYNTFDEIAYDYGFKYEIKRSKNLLGYLPVIFFYKDNKLGKPHGDMNLHNGNYYLNIEQSYMIILNKISELILEFEIRNN